MEHIPYFGVATGEIGGAAVTVSRTGYSGDLGYEVWVDAPDALHVWDTLWESVRGLRRPAVRARRAVHAAHRGRPAPARRRLRLEPLRLERRPPLHADRARLGLDVPRPRRPTTGRSSAGARSSASSRTRRRAGRCAASSSTGRTTTGSTTRPGSSRPRTTRPSSRTGCVYDDDYRTQVGYATSFMYSPMLQRHIAIARVRPDFAAPGTQGEARVHRRPPLRAGRRARRPAAALQPGAKDGLR